jgi:hypothetical protein
MQPFAGASKPSNQTRSMPIFGLIWPRVKVFLCAAHIASRQSLRTLLSRPQGRAGRLDIRAESPRVYLPLSSRPAGPQAGAQARIASNPRHTGAPPDQVPGSLVGRIKVQGGSPVPDYELMGMGRAAGGRSMPPRRAGGVRRRALAIIQAGAAEPPLRHPGPYGSVFGAVRELGHKLAFGGKSQEFL